ncbi:hypothetical protein N9L06_01450 [Mariniblastus sp.]|nr:hypothetical protein [Mariniblastus sp.]
MTPESIAQFGLAVNAARFLISEDLATTASSIRDFFASKFGSDATPKDREILLSSAGLEYVVSLRTISIDILNYLSDEVNKAESAYVRCLKAATSRGERNKCDRDAENIICEALERSKLRNGGILPSPFEPAWKRYGCG